MSEYSKGYNDAVDDALQAIDEAKSNADDESVVEALDDLSAVIADSKRW